MTAPNWQVKKDENKSKQWIVYSQGIPEWTEMDDDFESQEEAQEIATYRNREFSMFIFPTEM